MVCLAVLVACSLYIAHKLRLEYFPLNDALVFAVVIIYEVVVPAATGGLTPGRLLAGVVPIGENGKRPSIWQYAARTLARLALFALFVVFVAYELDLPSLLFVCVVEALFCLFTKNHQTLGDMVARTLVTRRKAHAETAA
jgi:uncharacterized RDD family membrane protein YckC